MLNETPHVLATKKNNAYFQKTPQVLAWKCRIKNPTGSTQTKMKAYCQKTTQINYCWSEYDRSVEPHNH